MRSRDKTSCSNTPRDARSLEQATNSGMAEAAHLNALRIMGAFELNRRLAGSGVDAFAVHPGVARTEVWPKPDFWVCNLCIQAHYRAELPVQMRSVKTA